MFIQSINGVNNRGYVYRSKGSGLHTAKSVDNFDQVSFNGGYGSAYQNIFSQALSHDLRTGRHAEEIFEMLRRGALEEGTVQNNRLMNILNSRQSLRDLLFDIKMAVKGAGYSGDQKIVTNSSGKSVIETNDTSILFPDPISGPFTDSIEFGIDSKYDVVVERPFDKVKFYQNNQLREITKYTSDYSSSSTKYYNKDGSERSIRNFFSDFGI